MEKLENLRITGEKSTFFIPQVEFNAENEKCLLAGECYVEDTFAFFDQLMAWLKSYSRTRRPITFEFKLTYFNTSASKGILLIMLQLKKYQESGAQVTVNWYYPEKDPDFMEEAEDFMEDTNLKMNIIAY